MTVLYYSFNPYKSEEFIRLALKKFTGENKNFEIFRTEKNMPYVKEENIFFSLSHTEGLIACSVSNKKTGVDAEKIRSIRNKEKILSRFLNKQIKNISDENFFAEWTRFESIVKYNGETILNPGKLSEKSNITVINDGGYIISVCSEDKIIEKEQIK